MKAISTMLLFFLASFQYRVAANIIYVDASATGAGNGSGWANAYTTLTAALNAANSGNTIDSLFIAAGTYYPPGTLPSNDTSMVFGIYRGGIRLYGGFPAGGGMRDTSNHVVLSGSLNARHASLHVMVIAGIGASADSVIVDGVTITGGAAKSVAGLQIFNGVTIVNRYGGGIYIIDNNTPIEVSNCIIKNNSAAGRNASLSNTSTDAAAGGIYVQNSIISINNLMVANNRCQGGGAFSAGLAARPGQDSYGGGVYMDSVQFSFTGCLFSSDAAVGATNGYGGAIYCRQSSGSFSNCGFGNNTLDGYGGAIYTDSSTVTVTNCTFYGNKAYSLTLIHWNSFGPGQGSAIYTTGGSTAVYNSILWNNPGPTPVYTNNSVNGTNSVINSIYQGGYGGPGNLNIEPEFVNPTTNNFHLLRCGAGINAGNNTYVANISTDADGMPRIYGGTVDMGMYELQDTPGHAPLVSAIVGPASWCPGITTVQFISSTPGGVWSSTDTLNVKIDSNTGIAHIVPNYADGYDIIRYTVSDSDGCYTSQALNIALVAKDWLMVDDGNGYPLTMFVATPLIISNPRWISCDSGIGVVHYGFSFTPKADGNYAAVIDIAGCPDTSFCYSEGGVGVITVTKTEQVKVYPNPTTDHIIIATDNSVPTMITLKNMLGAIIKQLRPMNSVSSMPLSDVLPGTYLLDVSDKDRHVIKTIVIQ